MAYITNSGTTPCYSCGKQCINVEFCNAGGSHGQSADTGGSTADGLSLSRRMRVKIVANESVWGFSGTLIEGWATYSNGYYDFFDGHDEDHQVEKSCTNGAGVTTSFGIVPNESRPDVGWRSVYNPKTDLVHDYFGTSEIESTGGLGGAEVYLVDRGGGTSDSSSCEVNNVANVFRKNPLAFGFGNKINFYTKIYKNITGAWRYTSVDSCYDTGVSNPAGYLQGCSGIVKQNILYQENQYQQYEPTRRRAFDQDSLYYNYDSGCLPDGSVAGNYKGFLYPTDSIYRGESGIFVQAKLSYGKLNAPKAASGLVNGMSVAIHNDVNTDLNDTYRIFDVEHQDEFTTVKLAGTQSGTSHFLTRLFNFDTFDIDTNYRGHWVALGTHDPQTCCGLNAYGVNTTYKTLRKVENYHSDLRSIFNSPKNQRQSNRDANDRYTYGLDKTEAAAHCTGIMDRTYPKVIGVEFPDGSVTGYVALSSGNIEYAGLYGGSGSPIYEREKSYYGNFFDVDRENNNDIRNKTPAHRGKGNNATCYSKRATIEVYPDCVTQYDQYDECITEQTRYPTNLVPRLSFVYRGCEYHDECSFDESGLPIGGWNGGSPSGIEDLKRLLAGTEMHMFVNLGDAWGGRKPHTPCACDCSDDPPPGQKVPLHTSIPTPVSFPSFPNFDLNPSQYGCQDPRYQIKKALEENNGVLSNTNYCDPLHTSSGGCDATQPYTTYGYIVNYCGREDRDRYDVIANAFANRHQNKTYTNQTPEVDIDEPMYWSFTSPTPGCGATTWSSGTTGRGDGNGAFTQTAGSGYGWWGIADTNKQVVAPYFPCTVSSGRCCPADSYQHYIEFDQVGLEANGWPKDAVPFLVEIEFDDFCGGCVSTVMKDTPLTLSLEGLDGTFIWNEEVDEVATQGGSLVFDTESNTRYLFGHKYCNYGDERVETLDRPAYDCSGWDLQRCDIWGEELEYGSGTYEKFGHRYTGNTCACIDSLPDITLSARKLEGTDIIIGWRSGNGDADELIELEDCQTTQDRTYDENNNVIVDGKGHRVFAHFELACGGMHEFLYDPVYPDAQYGSNPVDTLWTTTSSCGHRYPASTDYTDGDLKLHVEIYVVPKPWVETFLLFNRAALQSVDFDDKCGFTAADFYGTNGIGLFGLCPGDIIKTYGCKTPCMSATSGTDYFQGCTNPCYGGKTCGDYSYHMCNTCPTTPEEGDPDWVNCVQCSYTGYETPYVGLGNASVEGSNGAVRGLIEPAAFNIGGCGCVCTKGQKGQEPRTTDLIATYEIAPGNTGMTLISGTDVGCADVYWYEAPSGNIGPIYNQCRTPYERIAKKYTVQDHWDWHSWSHGVNAIHSGIQYELVSPRIGTTLECSQLTVPNCENECEGPGGPDFGSQGCGQAPIWNGSGVAEGLGTPDVAVRQKKCQPEVAIVTEIACNGGNYSLTLSREYHENNRTWKERRVTGLGTTACFPINVGAYVYPDSGTSESTGCVNMNYMMPTHTVTPAFSAPCSVHYSSGAFASQDFRFYQVGSGGEYWNYYNLYYGSGGLTPPVGYLVESLGQKAEPDNSFDPNCPPDPTGYPPKAIYYEYLKRPLFTAGAGDLAKQTNRKHSCIQDASQCGGGMWCNKLFFPRRSYKEGTKIAPFGAGVICTQNAERQLPNWEGYNEISQEPISTAEGLIAEAKTKFVDFCDDRLIQSALYDVGIDAVTITVDDYLPLIGVLHPGFRYNVNMKSCLVVTSGCTDIPLHSDKSIAAGVHAPKTFTQNAFDSMGYWLDRNEASVSDACLFNPFKILIDVECNTNRIERRSSTDGPTYLKGVLPIPPRTCQGTKLNPGCNCIETRCADNSAEKDCGVSYVMLTHQWDVQEGGEYPMISGGADGCDPDTGCFNAALLETKSGRFLRNEREITGGVFVPRNAIEIYGDGDGTLEGFTNEYHSCDSECVPEFTEVGNAIETLGATIVRLKCDEEAWDDPDGLIPPATGNGGVDPSSINRVPRYFTVSMAGDDLELSWIRRWPCKKGPNNAEVGYGNPDDETFSYSSGMYSSLCDCEAIDDIGICHANHYCPNGGWDQGKQDNVWVFREGEEYGPEGKWQKEDDVDVSFNCGCITRETSYGPHDTYTAPYIGQPMKTAFDPRSQSFATRSGECECLTQPVKNWDCDGYSYVSFTITEGSAGTPDPSVSSNVALCNREFRYSHRDSGVQNIESTINLQNPSGGVVVLELQPYNVVDKFEIVHTGVVKATSSMSTSGNYGPFDETSNTGVDQYIGANQGTVPSRLTDFKQDTQFYNYNIESFYNGVYQPQMLWWTYTSGDYAASTSGTLRISGPSGSDSFVYRDCDQCGS